MPEADFVKFERQLEGITQQSIPLVVKAVGRGLELLQSIIQVIPPQPDRNRSRHFNTYVRGIGHLPMSAFFTKKGAARKSIKTKGAIRDSEQSSRRWQMTTEPTETGVTGTLENTASYSRKVWGPGLNQVNYHAQTGWVNADDALTQAMPQIDAVLDQLLSEILDELAK